MTRARPLRATVMRRARALRGSPMCRARALHGSLVRRGRALHGSLVRRGRALHGSLMRHGRPLPDCVVIRSAPPNLGSLQSGQATVELVALLPLLLIAGLVGAAVIAAQAAGEQAGQAAQAGAMALIQGGDPRAAARAALPAAARERSVIVVDGRRVTVRVRPRVPFAALARPLTGQATADAGPEP
jgi:hypothetical protein